MNLLLFITLARWFNLSTQSTGDIIARIDTLDYRDNLPKDLKVIKSYNSLAHHTTGELWQGFLVW